MGPDLKKKKIKRIAMYIFFQAFSTFKEHQN